LFFDIIVTRNLWHADSTRLAVPAKPALGGRPGICHTRAIRAVRNPMSETYELYYSATCGYCHRVRRYLEQAGWQIPLKDTLRDPAARAELVSGGGKSQVPCLRIRRDGEDVWLYESLDIIDYLKARREQVSGTG